MQEWGLLCNENMVDRRFNMMNVAMDVATCYFKKRAEASQKWGGHGHPLPMAIVCGVTNQLWKL